METNYSLDSLNERINFYCDVFKTCEDKVEGLYLLKKILVLLNKKQELDPRIKNFLNKIQEDKIDLNRLDAENYYIFCKEIDKNKAHPVSYFLEKEPILKETDIMGINVKRSRALSRWEYLEREINSIFEKYFDCYKVEVLLS